MKTLAIVQARMGSTRFPDKVMQPIRGVPLIGTLLGRLSRARTLDKIVLATSKDPRNGPLVDYVRTLGYDVVEGSENDVLDRFREAAALYRPEVIVRVTGDCPLIDPDVVDSVVEAHLRGKSDYTSNVAPPTFPDGLDCEVFSCRALEAAAADATRPEDREHVTTYIRNSGKFSTKNIVAESDFSGERWTVDVPEDLEVLRAVFDRLAPRTDF